MSRFVNVALTALSLLLTPVLALAPSAQARPTPKPAPAIFIRSVMPAPNGLQRPGMRWAVELVIRKDGTLEQGGAVIGRLAKDEVADLQRHIKRTRFKLDHGVYPVCTGLPTRREKVWTNRGAVSWAAPCSKRPDRSVLELLARVDQLVYPSRHRGPTPHELERPPAPPSEGPAATELAPLLVSLQYERLSGKMGLEAISIQTDGQWTRSDRLNGEVAQGRLDTAQLAILRDRIAQARQGPPERFEPCGARLDGHATLSLPGHEAVRWSLPCGQLNDSLQAVVREVQRLTRR